MPICIKERSRKNMQERCLHQQKTTTMKKSISVIVLFVIILTGCTHYYYAPNVQNVPLFTGKNEFRLSGQFGYTVWDLIELGDQQTTCIDLQSAYSLTNNIGLMINYMTAHEKHRDEESTISDYGRGNYFEGAIGYYKPVSSNGIFEIYGGVGTSGQHHQYTNSVYNESSQKYVTQVAGTSDLTFMKLFVQPSVGFKLNTSGVAFLKPFDIAL